MNEHIIVILTTIIALYSLYCVNRYRFEIIIIDENDPEILPALQQEVPEKSVPDATGNRNEVKIKTKTRIIPLFFYNSCSILEVFTEKPKTLIKKRKTRQKDIDNSSNAIAVIGITVFLVALGINAVLDALKAKEEERERRKLNPEGERRQSLSEFANKKQLRRESSRFGLQLFQIAESVVSEEKSRKQSRQYTRGDSTNSYLSDRKGQTDGSTPTETAEPRLVKRQSVAKLFGLSDD